MGLRPEFYDQMAGQANVLFKQALGDSDGIGPDKRPWHLPF